MNRVPIFILLFVMGFQVYGNCGNLRESKKNKLIFCSQIKGLTKNKKQKHIVSIFNEVIGRGLVIKVFGEGDYKKPLFEKGGVGEVLGELKFNASNYRLLAEDLDGDGVKEFMFKSLTERASSFFMFSYDEGKKTFFPKKFSSPYDGKIETEEMLIGSIDFPIKVHKKHIDVYYEKTRYYRYIYKAGGYHLK